MEIPIEWSTQKEIKELETDFTRFPKEFKSQQYEVMRVILPEHAQSVGVGSVWGKDRVAIQMLGAFQTKKKATEYAEYVMKMQDWADVVVFDKYEWITLPPEQSIQELEMEGEDIDFQRGNPTLQKYCDALRKNAKEEQMIMQMRIDAAKKGKDGGQDLATKEYADWTQEQRKKQMQEIVDNPKEYTESMVEFAKTKLAELDASSTTEEVEDGEEK
jgi:hypothetical protein